MAAIVTHSAPSRYADRPGVLQTFLSASDRWCADSGRFACAEHGPLTTHTREVHKQTDGLGA